MVKLLFDAAEEAGQTIDLDSQDFWGNTVLHMLANAPAKPLKYVRTVCETSARGFFRAKKLLIGN